MPPPVADDDHKRRARRRLIGAVALTIVAVIILPLVLEDKPPPAGPLEVHMPQAAKPVPAPPPNVVEYAPSPANSIVEAPEPEKIAPAPVAAGQESGNAAASVAKAAPLSAKSPGQQIKTDKPEQKPAEVVYTVQVGVFADKVNVQKLQSRITALGIKSYTDGLDGSTRVRVGTFKERQDAEAMLAKLTAAGIKGQVVEK